MPTKPFTTGDPLSDLSLFFFLLLLFHRNTSLWLSAVVARKENRRRPSVGTRKGNVSLLLSFVLSVMSRPISFFFHFYLSAFFSFPFLFSYFFVSLSFGDRQIGFMLSKLTDSGEPNPSMREGPFYLFVRNILFVHETSKNEGKNWRGCTGLKMAKKERKVKEREKKKRKQ